MKTQKITVKILVAVLLIVMLLPCIAACSSGEIAPEDFEQNRGNETSNNDLNNNGNQNSNQNNGQNNNQGPADNNGGDSNKNEDVEINSIGEFHDGLAVIDIKTAGHKYYTNSKGQEIEYKPHGYIDTKGNIVIAPQYTEASNFKNGLARVGIRGKFGYIDAKGNVVIDIVYDSASKYFEDIAIVEKDGVKQYINAEGTVLYTVTGKETALGEVSNGYFYVETLEELISGNVYTMTYIRYDGEKFVVNDARHANLWYYGKNYVLVDGLDFSLINQWGCSLVTSGEANLKIIRIKDGTVEETEITYSGRKTITDNYFAGDFYDVSTGKTTKDDSGVGYSKHRRDLGNDYYYSNRYIYDKEGWDWEEFGPVLIHKTEVVVFFEEVSEFANASVTGMARCEYNNVNYFAVLLQNKSGSDFVSLIDETGKVLIAPTNKYNFIYSWEQYDHEYYGMLPIVDGLICARSSENSLYGYIGLDGEWVIQPQYQSATDFYGKGDDAVAVVNNNTIINRKGEIVFTIAE